MLKTRRLPPPASARTFRLWVWKRPLRQMTISQLGNLWSLSMTPRRLIPESLRMIRRKMMPLQVPTRHISQTGMILIGPIGLTHRIVITDVTRESGRSTDSDIPRMLRRRKIGVKAKWSCLCSEIPQRRAP